MERIGVLGVGRMGLPIASRLAVAGFDVIAFDADPSAVTRARETGISTASSGRDLARTSTVLITILPGPQELRSAMLGADGALTELRPEPCWLDLTSNDPRVASEVAETAASAGVHSVGSPMAGSPADAAAGSLGFFVAGAPLAVERTMPILSVLGPADKRRTLGSDIRAGFTTKLMANTLWFGQVVAVTEMLLLGKATGIDVRTLADALQGSAGGGFFMTHHLESLLAGDYLDTFGIDRVVEELDTINGLAEEYQVPHDLSGLVAHIHQEALNRFGPVPGELLAAKLLEERGHTTLRAGSTSSEGTGDTSPPGTEHTGDVRPSGSGDAS
ncbi:3-hydroxyisobutyrate dehydrogenase-like beta-hydroxyacid dehydrogenase [Frondihabitans sp. PhB188]|uniref:NAD(P)-dependent oxidoreductase n=1 Tax=Frondihabitans sp. PhB188 TaxID=2485200 RepID=UPI000F48A817|nr:NAD(P)-dependent oxidoreductase [Frondihabitans sp. PhB188]ROQ37242.1 3-hydroxyisobutyrate dehydrogenase-like beta-hydroxyacid dehydrogenase [Frondihabitans sp. PhB188]